MVMALAVLAVLAGLPSPAAGQIRGPMLGWVWDSQKESIRPVLGIAGSSVLGKGLELGFAVKEPASRRLEGAAAGADRIVPSPRGTAAILWYAETKKLAVVSGLPANAVVRETDLSTENAPGAMAVSDDGGLMLVAYPDARAVAAVDAEGNRWRLPKEASLNGIAFLEGSRDALLAAEEGVFLVRDVAGSIEVRLVWEGPASAVVSLDRQRALAVDGSAQTIVEVRLDSSLTRSASCPCSPTGLSRMNPSGVFRLNEVSRAPLWLVEVRESGLRTVFVPPDASDPEAQEGAR